MFNPLSKVRGAKQLFRFLFPPGNLGKPEKSREQKVREMYAGNEQIKHSSPLSSAL